MTLPPPGSLGLSASIARRRSARRRSRSAGLDMLLTGWRRHAAGAGEHGARTQVSEGRRKELVDQSQNNQEDEAGAEAPGDQLLLDRQQRLVRGVLELAADIVLRHATCSSERSASPVTSRGDHATAAGRAFRAARRSP